MDLNCLYDGNYFMLPEDESCGLVNYRANYNMLPSVEEASLRMKGIDSSDAFLEFMHAASVIAHTSGLENNLGFRLVHNHFFVQEDDQIMLEEYDLDKNALITSAQTINRNRTDIYPSSWILSESGDINFFEFSSDEKVKAILDEMINSNLLAEFHALLIQYNLQHLLALSILSRDTLSNPYGYVYLEKSDIENENSIVSIVMHNETLQHTVTSWSLSGMIQHKCFEAEIIYCQTSNNGHDAVRRHTGL